MMFKSLTIGDDLGKMNDLSARACGSEFSSTGRPEISIITPVLNGQSFIRDCLENVMNQQEPRCEHVIVDGGSRDGTMDIVRSFAGRYGHLRWISEPDRGQSDAMNKGIRMARGRIIGFLNVDDFYSPGTLTEVLKIFENLDGNSLLVGNCRVIDADGRLLMTNRPVRITFEDLLMTCVRNQSSFPMNSSAYFYHKTLHQSIGGYDIGDHYSMDLDFWLRASQTAHILYRDSDWGHFRYREGTKSYRDSANTFARKMRLFERYYATLPRIRKICFKLKLYWLNLVVER